jgi:F-type H+-transporting ATPase subunit a
MEGLEGLEQPLWNPLGYFGFDNELLKINGTTVINTWIVLLVIVALILVIRYFLKFKKSLVRFTALRFVKSFVDLVTQSVGSFIYRYFALITSLFIFILLCNCIIVLPWTQEPTQDVNTTIALALISFFYKEIEAIRTHGIIHYLKEFLDPFFIMLPINVIGHFSKIVSLAFRLFGNIFGGSIIMEFYTHAISGKLLTEILGLLTGINFIIILFFGIFEGLIQAFVFTMLSLTYLTIATQKDTEVPAQET